MTVPQPIRGVLAVSPLAAKLASNEPPAATAEVFRKSLREMVVGHGLVFMPRQPATTTTRGRHKKILARVSGRRDTAASLRPTDTRHDGRGERVGRGAEEMKTTGLNTRCVFAIVAPMAAHGKSIARTAERQPHQARPVREKAQQRVASPKP